MNANSYSLQTRRLEQVIAEFSGAKIDDSVRMGRRELENIRRSKFKDGYDPYDTAPVWSHWLKSAKGLLRA